MNIKINILSFLLLFSFIMTAQNEYYELRTYIIPYNAAEKVYTTIYQNLYYPL